MNAILVDTGPLYAVADRDDEWHDRVRAFLETNRHTLVVHVTVLPEACYLIGSYLGASAEIRFIRSVNSGEVRAEPLSKADLTRTLDGREGTVSGP